MWTWHIKSIAIILDVVYNHAFGQCPLVQLYWDDANSRPASDSPYFNVTAKHPYNVGYDFNHESQATKYYVKQGLEHWIENYHVDGFRFDLSKGFTQKYSSSDSQMAAYDATRIAILEEYADFIWDINPDVYVILEHFADNTEEKELANYGLMLWGNNNYQYNEATMGYGSNLTNMLYTYKGWNEPNLVGYMESHDEERLMYKNLQYGNSFGDYNIKDLNTALDRMKLAGTFFFLIPGPKMMWQFCETGYEYSLYTCSNGTTVDDDCKLEPKPIRWDYLEDEYRKSIYNTYSSLTYLKKEFDVFNSADFTYSLNYYVKSLHLNNADMNATILGNFNVVSNSVTTGFQHTGMWYEFFTGDSINVTDTNMVITFDPGEYRLYTDKKIQNSFITSTDNVISSGDYTIFPNPSSQYVFILGGDNQLHDSQIELFDITGKRVISQKDISYDNQIVQLDISGLENGVYIIRIKTDNKISFNKIIVSK
ncbi:MAG: T9SS type A sorting domain-containing protein [Saprospiraceae bacterium]